ncbi:MAG: SDR family oxidoreductase [Sphingomicrobium sp.]
MPYSNYPRIVITGACDEVGRACAEALRQRGATLVLSDNDGPALSRLSASLGAIGMFCDVVSSSSIQLFAAELLAQNAEIDVLINAAGGGYERTLGMHRVSRALMPALRSGDARKWILNVPPGETAIRSRMFPYASSREAFARLSEALAQEVRGSNVSVGIACPSLGKIEYACNLTGRPPIATADLPDDCAAVKALAERVADLVLPS